MSTDNESFNRDLYDLLKVRGYNPVPLDSKNQRVPASQAADVIEFTFTKDGEDYGKAWVSIDDASNVIVYYDEEQQESPSTNTPGAEYDDSWTGFLKHLKNWAQRRQLSFELSNKDRLGDDMRQRDYYKMKEKLGESMQLDELSPDTMKSYKDKATAQRKAEIHKTLDKTNPASVRDAAMHTQGKRARGIFKADKKLGTFKDPNWSKGDDNAWIKRDARLGLAEGYHPMGKKASYNDAVPNVKIILQHNRSLEEGEQRYRNVAKIFLENQEGERFLAPTNKPGLARVYARHIAEGGLPNDEKWNHIKSICEDYSKMAGFVRATRKGQFNESAQELVQEGINHYNSLRETLHKLTGHRGYQAYFESWSPPLMEDELDESINELFVQEMVDPRIESAMPILSRLKKPVSEMEEVDTLAEWADDVINEKLELDEGDVIKFPKGWVDANDEGEDEMDWDDESWIPSIEDFEQEEEIRNRKRGPANDVNEMDKEHGSKRDFDNARGPDKTAKMMKAKDAVKAARKALDKAFKGDVDENFIGMSPQAVAEEEVEEGLDANQKRVGQLGPTGGPAKVGDLVGANESTEFADELTRIIDITRFNR